MLCSKVLKRLSEYLDEVLDNRTAVQLAQHLNQCESCRNEYERLSSLKRELKSLARTVQAPDYLRDLIQVRLAAGRQDPLHMRIRNVLERRWSIIRTTDGIWYLTRVLGTVMTSFLIFLISSAITPLDVNAHSTNLEPFSPAYRQQVGINVLRRLGMQQFELQANRKAAINNQYFLNFGQSVPPSTTKDFNLSVVTVVDRSGTAKVQDVIEYPDREILSSFNEIIETARCRPASKNGLAVTSHMVLMFSKISVYN
jgi:anti-sigma factor (TIGR02949 family)